MEKALKPHLVAQTKDSERVKVVVRCRPLSPKEIEDQHKAIIKIYPDKNEVEVSKDILTSRNEKAIDVKNFTFDGVFDQCFSQTEIYNKVFRNLVDSVLRGFNGTIFAYGQTGTGKTYTLTGDTSKEETQGILPNTFRHIFNHINSTPSKRFLVRASYLEIYQEDIRDLLCTKDPNGQTPIPHCEIREGPSGMYIKDLSSYFCANTEEILSLMEKGNKQRAVGRTNMNEHSSRSHAIFQITIEVSETWIDGKEHFKVGKLNLVDLAGSERQGKTGATGERFKEATKINLSLSALGNVISALVDGSPHIPYRDSKLTRLLQDSLGGNSRTIMIATVGPSNYNCEESLNTLRYANRAKNIKNKPHVNEDPKDAILRHYQEEIVRLRALLQGKKKLVSKKSSTETQCEQNGILSNDLGSGPGSNASHSDENNNNNNDDNNKTTRNNMNSSSGDDDRIVEIEELRKNEKDKRMLELTPLLEPFGIDSNGDFDVIMKQLEERKEALMKDTETAKEKKDKCLKRLQKVTEKVQVAEEQCTDLIQRIYWLEGKVLNNGKTLFEHTQDQEKQIEVQEKEMMEQELREESLRKNLEEQQLSTKEMKDKLVEVRNDLNSKQDKLKKLIDKIQRADEKKESSREEHHFQRTEMEIYTREMARELKLKKLIMDNFVPTWSKKKIESQIRYHDMEDYYFIQKATESTLQRPPVNRMLNYPLYSLAKTKNIRPQEKVFYTDENILLLEPEPPFWETRPFIPEKMDPRMNSVVREAFKNLQKSCVVTCSAKPSKQAEFVASHGQLSNGNHQYIGVGPNLLLKQLNSKDKYQDYSVVPSEVSLPDTSRIFLIPIPQKELHGSRKMTKEELYALPISIKSRKMHTTKKERAQARNYVKY